MANTHAQTMLLNVLFPTNWSKKNTKKRTRPELKYDALFAPSK